MQMQPFIEDFVHHLGSYPCQCSTVKLICNYVGESWIILLLICPLEPVTFSLHYVRLLSKFFWQNV